MNMITYKNICTLLLLLCMSAQAERVYTVDRIIIPEFHITLHNTTYTRKSNETQIFDNQLLIEALNREYFMKDLLKPLAFAEFGRSIFL